MQYRIKTEIYKNGNEIIRCQFNNGFLFIKNWIGVNYEGDADSMWKSSSECGTKEEALRRINLHFSIQNAIKEKPIKIDIEYVNK